MDDFCNIYNLWSLNELRTCYNNPNKITCIDLMLTNSPESFYNSYAIETSLSDFLQNHNNEDNFRKQEPKIIHHRD